MDQAGGPSREVEVIPKDLEFLVDVVKMLESPGGEADLERLSKGDSLSTLIARLRSLSHDDIIKLTGMKPPEFELTVLGHLCVHIIPSAEEVLGILLTSENVNNKEVIDKKRIPLLFLAAYCGNFAAVKSLCIVDGIDFTACSGTHNILHVAVMSGDTKVVRCIVEHAYQVSPLHISTLMTQRMLSGMSPLHYAAWQGDANMIQTLFTLEESFDSDFTEYESIKKWFDANSGKWNDLNEPQVNGLTAVHLASLNNHIGALRKLLDFVKIDRKSSKLEYVHQDKRKAFLSRSRINIQKSVANGISFKVAILQRFKDRATAWTKKRARTVLPFLNELMKKEGLEGRVGASSEFQEQEAPTGAEGDEDGLIGSADEEELIGLLEAIKVLEDFGNEAYEQALLGSLMSLSNRDIIKLTTMRVPGVAGGQLTLTGYLCIKKLCSDVITFLLVRADKTIRVEFDGHSYPLLHLSIYYRNEAAFELLFGGKADDIVVTSSTNLTAFHIAVKSGDVDITSKIISKAGMQLVNCGSQDDFGMTPLHYAVWEGNQRMIQLVLSLPEGVIDINASEKNGLTALHLASLNNDIHALSLLLNHPQVKPNASDINDLTALHIASRNNHLGVVSKLLDHRDINVNCADKCGVTALHTASCNNYVGVLCKLLDRRDIDLNASDVNGLTALHLPPWQTDSTLSSCLPIATTPSGESIMEMFHVTMEEMESHLWQFSIDRERKRLRTQMSPSYEAPETGWPKGTPAADLQEQERRGNENCRRAAELLFPTHDLSDSGKLTALLRAAWRGNSTIVTTVMGKISDGARARTTLNTLDEYGMSALHYAVMRGDAAMVTDLLSYPTVRGNVREERRYLTPLNMAYLLVEEEHLKGVEDRREIERKYRVIISSLSEHPDVKAYTEGLYRDRQLFVDAVNAILVGAALIASITFGGWLQPPLGYQPYYEPTYLLTGAAPPDTYASYASVGKNTSVQIFWVFNSLSFFFAVATVLMGACVVLPMLGKADLEVEVRRMRYVHVWTTLFLSLSVFFVLGAFIAAGFASLPPSLEYQRGMIASTSVGGCVSLGALLYYLYRVFTIVNLIWRAPKDEYGTRMYTKLAGHP
ncbi:unnamed protein product [Calypogeia fissa]